MHKEGNRYWLTDSEPEYVYNLHGLKEEISVPGKNILEVGVGTGRSVIYLSKSHDVYAVDISEVALEKVKSYATVIRVNDKDKWPENKIDIALCHLVFQHCDDNAFRFIMRQVLGSLTPDGFFTFQSADADSSKLDDNYKKLVNDRLVFFRGKSVVINVIKELGGRIIKVSNDILHSSECDIVWNIFRSVKV